MAVKFQYNKTSLQNISKQLKVREKALPTIKNKETALRLEVKKARNEVRKMERLYTQKMEAYKPMIRLWGEFDASLLGIEAVKTDVKKLAGVKTPYLQEIVFSTREFSLFNLPAWYMQGIDIVKELVTMAVERNIAVRKMQLLHHARRKTTQKVNLYEKVQIPGYQDAIRKIKRYLEDQENLSKSAQKIIKARLQEAAKLQA